MDKLLSIEECESYAKAIIGEDFHAPKLLPVRIAQQLADTMRENERLRHALKWLKKSPTQAAFDNIKVVLKPNKDSND